MRLGIDVGGTFVDLLAMDTNTGAVTVGKGASTPDAPEQGVMSVLRDTLSTESLPGAEFLVHGSTVALNALLEREVERQTVAGGSELLGELVHDLERPRLVRHEPFVDRDRDVAVVQRRIERGIEIRAVAGQEKVDPDDPKLQDLIARAAWAAGHGEQLYLCDRTNPASALGRSQRPCKC